MIINGWLHVTLGHTHLQPHLHHCGCLHCLLFTRLWQSASLVSNFIASDLGFAAWQFCPRKIDGIWDPRWNLANNKLKDSTIWISLCLVSSRFTKTTITTTARSVTSSSSSSTSSAWMSSADGSISLLGHRTTTLEWNVMKAGWTILCFHLFCQSYTVSWRTSGCKWAGLETSVEKKKIG